MSTHVYHAADSRGKAGMAWLKTFHTFSFAHYYDPERMNFGALRVLNDDTILGGGGFGMHPHDNMEIITLPLEGALEHKDSMGNGTIIHNGEIQVMSAGTGIFHSEFNPSKTEPSKLLQIWVFPRERNVTPRYDQQTIDVLQSPNSLVQILSPNPEDAGVWIHQDAWFHLGQFEAGKESEYSIRKSGNGVYAFVISGSFVVDGKELSERDGLGISDTEHFSLRAGEQGGRILLMDVPMY